MISFFHGFAFSYLLPLLTLPFLLFGYLFSAVMKQNRFRILWIGFLILGLIVCDAFYLIRNFNILGFIFITGTAWCFMQMLLGQGICALVNTIRLALRKGDREESQ